MKATPDKQNLLMNNNKESFPIKVGNETVTNSKYEKLLGVKQIMNEISMNMSHRCARRLARNYAQNRNRNRAMLSPEQNIS